MRPSVDKMRGYNRKSIRLKNFDYSQKGGYFITICTKGRECLFGDIEGGKIRLNPFGEIILDEWKQSAIIRQEIELDEYTVMPNHIHGIVIIKNDGLQDDNVGAHGRPLTHNKT